MLRTLRQPRIPRNLLQLGVLTGVLVVFVSVGCASRRSPPQGETVHRIRLEGNGNSLAGTSDYSVRTAMVQRHNPPFVWLVRPRQRRVYLDRQTLMTDGWRIETWYAHRGYFDARMVGWHVEEVRPAVHLGPWSSPEKVRIEGVIEEGEPSLVRTLNWDGLLRKGDEPLRRLMERRMTLQVGSRFDLAYVDDSEEEILFLLHEMHYAQAKVEIEAQAFPEEHAVDVQVRVDLGEPCIFGRVEIVGEYDAPESKVRDAILIEEGAPYKGSVLGQTQKELFALGIFSVVNIVPELSSDGGTVVPVRIEVSETHPKELRIGGGLGWENGKEEVHISADLKNQNLFGRLIRLELENELGYASISDLDDLELGDDVEVDEVAGQVVEVLGESAGPVVDISASVVVPDIPSRFIDFEQSIGLEVGVEPGYRFSSREVSPGFVVDLDALGVGRRSNQKVEISGGLHYRLQQFDYLEFNLDTSSTRDTPLQLDFTDNYLLSSLHQELEFDSRSDVLFTREGLYGLYTLTEAGGPLGGRFSFIRATFDQRGFIPLIRLRDKIEVTWEEMTEGSSSGRPVAPQSVRRSEGSRRLAEVLLRPTTLAGRLGGGLIVPYGDGERASVPYAERIRMGGSTDVRGWALDHLGPYVYDPDTSLDGESVAGQSQQSDDIIPVGGLVALHASAELRIYALNDYGLVLFTDVGNVWNEWSDMRDFTLLPSVGLGLRYVTPIGPLRVDVARRLDQEPMYALENRWALHISFSEAY